jgi:hypothetical protein
MSKENGNGHYQPLSVRYEFTCREDTTKVRVLLATGLDRTYRSDVVWSGCIPIGRRDLRGLDTRAATVMLSGCLHEWWSAERDAERERQRQAGVTVRMAAGPGAPDGATGRVVNVPLPGL